MTVIKNKKQTNGTCNHHHYPLVTPVLWHFLKSLYSLLSRAAAYAVSSSSSSCLQLFAQLTPLLPQQSNLISPTNSTPWSHSIIYLFSQLQFCVYLYFSLLNVYLTHQTVSQAGAMSGFAHYFNPNTYHNAWRKVA